MVSLIKCFPKYKCHSKETDVLLKYCLTFFTLFWRHTQKFGSAFRTLYRKSEYNLVDNRRFLSERKENNPDWIPHLLKFNLKENVLSPKVVPNSLNSHGL